ncbi:MAG: hypothetical protein II885_13375 [Oscillospiraceae bacterium]|nr:hypothetical protein [Oscillospiraceae bacterium]
MDIELRRRRINLSTLGTGVVAFGVWNVLKTILYIFTSHVSFFDAEDAGAYGAVVILIFYAFLGLLLTLDLSLRLYIGLSARAEGRGRRKGSGYIIAAAILFAMTAAYYVAAWVTHSNTRLENQAALDYYVSMFVDITAMIMLGDLLYTAVRARKLEKRMGG